MSVGQAEPEGREVEGVEGRDDGRVRVVSTHRPVDRRGGEGWGTSVSS